MKNSEIHTWAAFGTVFATAILVAPVVYFSSAEAAPPHHAPLEDMITIEATLAYKAPNAPKQPQKKTQEKEPEVKPVGVSTDDKQKPKDDPPKKDDKKKPDPKDVDPLKKFDHPHDEDTPTSTKPTDNLPAFDGSKYGTDRTTTGHPFWQKLRADLAWEYPQILNAAQPAIGCIHLDSEGKIAEITIHTKSGDDSLDDAAERSLKKLQKLRNDNPIPVPVELLRSATTEWACFKFDAAKPSD